MEIKITIPGDPVPKARARKGKGGHWYTPKKTQDYERLVQDVYKLQGKHYFGESALRCDIDLYFPIPKSYTKKRKERIRNGQELYTKKPDKDNCEKAIFDALNGIAYKDDSQVIKGETTKNYAIDGEPRAEVVIKEVNVEESEGESEGV